MKLNNYAIMFALMGMTAGVSAKTLEKVTSTYPIDNNGSISVENINGSISINSYGGNEIELTYIITGESEKDLDRVEVDIQSDDSSFNLETDHKSSGWGWKSGNNASVSYQLKVPHGLDLKLIDTVNGSIDIVGQFGDITADTVNGDIDIDAEMDDINLDTVNGSIELTMASISDQDISLDSVNGRLEINIPAGTSARIQADTVHGSIRNDFGLEVEKGWVGQEMDAKLGSGSASISLDTVNGSINIRK